MPLMQGKSPKSFSKNVSTEMHAGKPLKQSLAIAYNIKRKAKKMAKGGQVDNYESSCTDSCNSPCTIHPTAEYDSAEYDKSRPAKLDSKSMSEDSRKLGQHGDEEEGEQGGGQGFHDESYEGNAGDAHDEYQDTQGMDATDLISRIIKQHMFSKGGQVANQDTNITDEMPNEFDDLHLRDDLEFSDTDANSGDSLSDEQEDADRKDIIARVMKSWSRKDKLPRPA
jgi:hypothetical protein